MPLAHRPFDEEPPPEIKEKNKVFFTIRKRGGRKLVLAPDGAPVPPLAPQVDSTGDCYRLHAGMVRGLDQAYPSGRISLNILNLSLSWMPRIWGNADHDHSDEERPSGRYGEFRPANSGRQFAPTTSASKRRSNRM
jgi:hypothetical protein